MTVLYCTETDLKEYLLQAYLDKIEQINPGTVGRTLSNVSLEIREAILQGEHTIPETESSAVLKRICAVITAWRCVGDITSLMNTEAGSNNEWIPLQRLFDQSRKDLDSIRSGKLMPYPETDAGDPGISVSAPAVLFGPDTWGLF
ncbi:hypothetical protein DO021_19615 [Desulfobacter hydrogenophilus]|uniref:DUF1320 domain-containing protein n=1 Tax=Desulfobacter hydrogenophilus TaxID=2291 RepID=A0A328FBC6_9BACT|nr:phage protein Gp36 family protein [Desulfobacter hydrogenophilus]NDY73980.1 DUF1320 domain-containing protein [Desulfobacter hydrogenophilus]QBH14325.1 DUF1320 domain-containing protein [Desulfobacter hydrogenophilus]RAM00327.1 hypothetical protein DO021_19615 [Desulfobacter hydrogenophilus]